MKLKLPLLGLVVFLLLSLFFINKNEKIIKTKREIHSEFMDNHPYKKSLSLSKKERKSTGKAPNKYYDEQYLLEMNPATGKTEPEKLLALQKELNNQLAKTPGSDASNPWIERGPDNVPGRTRAMLYDPNDPTHKRVFAGGVTGGLWVIDDIESSTAVWQRIGISENLVVSTLTVDVNDSNIIYAGTGEPYVGAEGTGNGIWKSIDGGATWNHIFGGTVGVISYNSDALLTVNSGSVAGGYPAVQSGTFGPDIPSGGVTGDLILANDNSGIPSEGCNIFGSDATGKIAIIDRGQCNFTLKVKNAQDQNAIGVIIINSAADEPFAMGGTDATVTIPSVMIFRNDGQNIKQAMLSGTVNVTISPISTTLPVGVLVPGKFHVSDIITRNNNGTTEIYAAITESRHFGATLGGEYGIYKSTDGGASWTQLIMPLTTNGNKHMINDLLITSDNKIWAGSINSRSYGDGGGKVFVSTDDGATFTQKYAKGNGNRVELAASATNANKIYILMYTTDSTVELLKTTFGFNFPPSNLTKPNDPSSSPSNDFTNGQGWYDLGIAVDPTNDQKVYLAGISTFKSTNGGLSWVKSSHAYGGGSSSSVHADSHAIVMHPTDPNKGLVGNDGGVYYVNNWGNSQSNSSAMESRNKGYNTTQFYKGAIGQSVTNEKFLAGAQDNGTNFIDNASNGVNSSIEIFGGDGMYCFIDKDSQYMISSLYYNAYFRHGMDGALQTTIVNDQNTGGFVNIAELDDNLDILYSNATTSTGGSSSYILSRFKNIASSPSRTNLTNPLFDRSPSAMKVSPHTTTSSTLFIGSVLGQLLKVTNADTSPVWTEITGPNFNGSVSAINFGANENEIMVTFHNYGVINIKYTEDGGATWQDKEGNLPELPVKDILMNPLLNDEVIIATDLGVWKTGNFKDAYPNWTRSQNGMQNVKVTSFDLRTADNMILASTYGRGLFTGQFTDVAGLTSNEITKTNRIKVYPTVSNGNFTITASKSLNNTTLQIFDINGKKIEEAKLDLSNNKTSLNINAAKGIYFMNFTGENLKESHKIVIK